MSRRSTKRDPGLLTPGQAAKELDVTRETVMVYIKAGKIPAEPYGDGLFRLRRDVVDALKTRMEGTG